MACWRRRPCSYCCRISATRTMTSPRTAIQVTRKPWRGCAAAMIRRECSLCGSREFLQQGARLGSGVLVAHLARSAQAPVVLGGPQVGTQGGLRFPVVDQPGIEQRDQRPFADVARDGQQAHSLLVTSELRAQIAAPFNGSGKAAHVRHVRYPLHGLEPCRGRGSVISLAEMRQGNVHRDEMLLVKIVAEITDGSQRPDGRGLIASSKIDPSAGQSRK